MSDTSTSDSLISVENELYHFEPTRRVSGEDVAQQSTSASNQPSIPDPIIFCRCTRWQPVNSIHSAYCCQQDDRIISKFQDFGIPCVTEHADVNALLNTSVLNIMYEQWKSQNEEILNDSLSDFEISRKKLRFMAYRAMVFFLFPGMRRKERIPLPACILSYIHARHPPSDDEEIFADYQFTQFSFGNHH